MLNFCCGRKGWLLVAAFGLVLAAVVAFFVLRWGRPYRPHRSFDGPSDLLSETVIVPTLDSPIPEGKSAVWCASIQLGWDRLRKDVVKGPVRVQNAEALAGRLNAAEFPEGELAPADFYAAAGLAKDGIVERIKAEMAERFPGVPVSDLDPDAEGMLAYAFLKAGVKFDQPFFDNREPLTFTDSTGRSAQVKSFGVRKRDEYGYEKMREQVAVLYCPEEYIWREKVVDEFVLDPCKHTNPYQLILARVGRKATLAATIADVEQKIKWKPPPKNYSTLLRRDTLLVPTMNWRVRHRFKELEGPDKGLLGPPFHGRQHIARALQTIEFRLDRSGAEATSEWVSQSKPGSSRFELDRPFLVYLKKRGGSRPFFAMWVDNAELLQAW